MKLSTHFLILLCYLIFFSCSEEKKNQPIPAVQIEEELLQLNTPPQGFELLFNGKNFDGWSEITNSNEKSESLFSIENGMIRTYPQAPQNSSQPFGGLITTKMYKNYVLRLDYKWGVKKFKPRHEYVRDAGILFHVFNTNEFWPSGAECQIQEGDTGDLWLIATRGTSKVRNVNHNYGPDGIMTTRGGEGNRFESFARSNFWGGPGWNTIEIIVEGNYSKFTVNGHVVNELFDLEYYDEVNKKWNELKQGKILLQAEGAEIFYRNIYIKEF